MELLPIAVSFVAGGGFFGTWVSMMANSKRSGLRVDIMKRDETISDLVGELEMVSDKNVKLRVENRNKDQANEKLQHRIRALEPDAERGRKQREQSARALAAAQEANRKRNAAKLAGNVEPIQRKRA